MEQQRIPLVKLEPGELFIANRPAEVETILGSCVAVSLFDPRLRLGAICHSRLARQQECRQVGCGLKVCRNLGDYVTCSLRFMLAYLDQHGSVRKELEVKLFGGAKMFNNLASNGTGSGETIGKRNVEAAMEVIRGERLHLLAADVGGMTSRLLTFSTLTGEVRLRRGRVLFPGEDGTSE